MAKKRKSEARTRLDEVDRTMHSTFCSAANSLSQIYSQAVALQRSSFHAGERHALEKLYQWIMRQHQEGARLIAADVVAYLQKEISYEEEDSSVSPTLQSPRQHVQSTMHHINPSIENSTLSAQEMIGVTARNGYCAEPTNVDISNARYSPILQSVQPSHISQGGYSPNNDPLTGIGARNHEMEISNKDRNSNYVDTNDSFMEMH